MQEAEIRAREVFAILPFGPLKGETPGPSGPHKRGSSLRNYGLNQWGDLFSPRQLLALGTFVKETREVGEAMRQGRYPPEWTEAICCYLAAMLDRLANQSSNLTHWNLTGENIEGTFARFAFPIVWDFAEVNPLIDTSGGYPSALEWVSLAVDHFTRAVRGAPAPHVACRSAKVVDASDALHDVIVTDPPYYDAIPYADLMDFFHLWLRRTLKGIAPDLDEAFLNPGCPKWNVEQDDGELIDDPGRHNWNAVLSKGLYEEGMFHAFQASHRMLTPEGRLVIVFAHKQPDAWETLVSAVIRAGFIVDGSWPIQTERTARVRSLSSAALSSSIWLVCKKRPAAARPGWDSSVLADMQKNIHQRLRDFWDAGIRGPDFVWAATGPALEAFSKHPVVKKADSPTGEPMTVAEFLRAVRRIVVDFIVGCVLEKSGAGQPASGLDDVTTYYLLHRHAFGLEKVPAGACILYAVSCGLSDDLLLGRLDLLAPAGGKAVEEPEEAEDSEESEDPAEEPAVAEAEPSSKARVRLKTWQQRTRRDLGEDGERGPAPLIDQVHRLLHLWAAGEEQRVREFLERRGLVRNNLFAQVLQALIELAGEGSDERSRLERLSNYLKGLAPASGQLEIPFSEES